jgi:ABC-type bacteriocin/lantibiotic exporter with double-glycine peptidase domain
MPSKLQQIVGESGWQLSHGERGRLFAPSCNGQGVVVLDESFAALDPENLQQALDCALRRAPARGHVPDLERF